VHGLARALVLRGHAVEVFTTDLDVEGRVPVALPVDLEGVRVSYFPLRAPRRMHWAPALKGMLRRRCRDFDVVHLHSIFLWPTSAAARVAEAAGVPYVLAPRGMLVRALLEERGRLRKLAWLRMVERRTIEHAIALHVTSEREADDVREAASWLRLALPPLVVIPNGIAVEVDSETPPSPVVETVLARPSVVLFLGRLSWKKGLDLLLAALPHAPDVTLAIAGGDDEGLRLRLEALAAQHGITRRVAFLGHVEGADRAALLHRSAALVLPSRNEKFGNVVLEAMSCGTPVVVTPAVGLADEVRRAGCGLVAEAEPAALGCALRDVAAATADVRREWGVRGRAAAAQYAWPAIAARAEQLLYPQVVDDAARVAQQAAGATRVRVAS
jgi:glycosyltransferase involved in cell wall biosynthesis